MRLGAACAGVSLALAVAACDVQDRRYFLQGVGSDLSWEGQAVATDLQEVYIGHVCRQAGLDVMIDAAGLPRCISLGIDRLGWTLFVQAGMNDIDQRCDAYLNWLDSRRKISQSILAQISDTGTQTAAILTAATVSTQAMGVVAASFGLISATFRNWDSRLLLEVEKSTVQTIVYGRQQEFREKLPAVIDNRPAALHALRSYLRLCLPFTIEAEINTTVKLFERGGERAAEASRSRSTDTTTIRSITARSAIEPLPAVRRIEVVTDDPRLSRPERSLTVPVITRFQKVACVTPANGRLGPSGSPTRQAIRNFLVGSAGRPATQDDVLTALDIRNLLKAERENRRAC